MHCVGSAGSVQVKQGDFDRLHLLRMEQWTKEQGEQRMTAVNRKFTVRLIITYSSFDFFIVKLLFKLLL